MYSGKIKLSLHIIVSPANVILVDIIECRALVLKQLKKIKNKENERSGESPLLLFQTSRKQMINNQLLRSLKM